MLNVRYSTIARGHGQKGALATLAFFSWKTQKKIIARAPFRVRSTFRTRFPGKYKKNDKLKEGNLPLIRGSVNPRVRRSDGHVRTIDRPRVKVRDRTILFSMFGGTGPHKKGFTRTRVSEQGEQDQGLLPQVWWHRSSVPPNCVNVTSRIMVRTTEPSDYRTLELTNPRIVDL